VVFDKMEQGNMNFDGYAMPDDTPQFEKIIK
jgi:hypothetical protein